MRREEGGGERDEGRRDVSVCVCVRSMYVPVCLSCFASVFVVTTPTKDGKIKNIICLDNIDPTSLILEPKDGENMNFLITVLCWRVHVSGWSASLTT